MSLYRWFQPTSPFLLLLLTCFCLKWREFEPTVSAFQLKVPRIFIFWALKNKQTNAGMLRINQILCVEGHCCTYRTDAGVKLNTFVLPSLPTCLHICSCAHLHTHGKKRCKFGPSPPKGNLLMTQPDSRLSFTHAHTQNWHFFKKLLLLSPCSSPQDEG